MALSGIGSAPLLFFFLSLTELYVLPFLWVKGCGLNKCVVHTGGGGGVK